MSPKISSSELSQMSPEQRRTILQALNKEAAGNDVVKFVLSEWRFDDKNDHGRVTENAMKRYLDDAKGAQFAPEKIEEVEQNILKAKTTYLPKPLKDAAEEYKAKLSEERLERTRGPEPEPEPEDKFDIVAVGNAVITDPKSLSIDKIFPLLRLIASSVEDETVTLKWAQEVKHAFQHAPKRIMRETASPEEEGKASALGNYYQQAFEHFGKAIPDPAETDTVLWEKQKAIVTEDSRVVSAHTTPSKKARFMQGYVKN